MPSQPLEFFISFDVLKSQTSWGIFSMNLGKAAMFVPRFWVSWQDWYQTLVSVFPNSVLFYQETMRPPDRKMADSSRSLKQLELSSGVGMCVE